MGVSQIGFPQNVVYKQRIQTSDTLPVTIGASKYCEFLFDIDAGDRMTPLGIVGWGCDDKTQVFLLDFYMDNDLQTAKLILKNPYATTIAINSLYIDVLYSKQGLDMSEVDVVDNLTTDSAVAALSAKQGKVLKDTIDALPVDYEYYVLTASEMYNLSNPSIYVQKFGRICRLTWSSGGPSVVSSGWGTYANVPEKYRPSTRGLGFLMDDSSLTVHEAVVEINGNVRIWNAVANHAYWGSIIYFL